MSRFVLCLLGTFIVLSASANVVRLSEPVATDASSETFGSTFDSTQPVLSLADATLQVDALAGKLVLIKTRVAKVCQKKGCFFIAQEGALAVRVSFRDYGFFVPSDSGGKTVTLVGEIVRVQRSKAEAEHFGADLGGSEVASGAVYEIVADGVRVPI